MIESSVLETTVSRVGFDVAACELETVVMCGSVQLDRMILLKGRRSPYKSSAFSAC